MIAIATDRVSASGTIRPRNAAPLAALIERYVDAALLAEVAAAHHRGRRLYMGTVDLDTRSFVVWNMGLIAGRGDERALALFRTVMLASSSVPVAFPPVSGPVPTPRPTPAATPRPSDAGSPEASPGSADGSAQPSGSPS